MADLITNLYTVIAPTFLMSVILSPFIFHKYLFCKKKDNNICGDYIDSDHSDHPDHYGDFSDDDESNIDKIRTTITFPDEKEYDGLLHITFISKDFIDLKRKIKKIKFQFKKLH